MTHLPLTVLAVNPGSRYLSFAIMQGTRLIDWRMKRLRGSSAQETIRKGRGILLQLLLRYQPTILTVKKLDHCRSSRLLDQLVEELTNTADIHGVTVRRYPLRQFKRFFTGTPRSNKHAMAELIAAQYPDLLHELDREKSAKNSYYIRLFEAVALAALAAHEVDNS